MDLKQELIEVMRKARQEREPGTPRLEAIADALLARGLRLPGGDETMAWAVVGEDGLKVWSCNEHKPIVAHCAKRGERVVRVAIRVVEGGDDA